MFCESQPEQRGSGNDDDDQDNGHEEMEDAEEQRGSGEETTASGAARGGSETSSQAKRCRRRPNRVGTVRELVRAVDPASGLPTEPKKLAKGYGLQVAAILRDVVNLNEVDIRDKNKVHLRIQLISRLHARYEFPDDYNNQDLTKNIVNTAALAKFSKALSSFKTMVRGMISEGDGFEEIHRHFPRVTEEDLKVFLANEELEATKTLQAWGKKMREQNIGNHHLGCHGYDGKEEIWEKEDREYIAQGIEKPYDKYTHPETKRFIRSRYHKETETGKLVTDPKVVQGVVLVADQKVKDLEKAVVSNLPA
jgi:uncharacterized protein YfbU (UPF0304 family)